MMGIRVMDLNAGLGGRAYAFKEAGFEIVAAIDNEADNCEIISSWLDNTKIINFNLLDLQPDSLPDADLITAKYLQQSSLASGNKTNNLNDNIVIYNIIAKKRPIFLLLEVPINSITSKRQSLEDYIQKFTKLGYDFTYVVYDEMSFSGYPVVGKKGYIIGCRGGVDKRFEFPRPVYLESMLQPIYDKPELVDSWYRKINQSTSNWEKGNWYYGIYGKVEKTEKIHLGNMRENYLVDAIGPRRFTHNEFAALKGLYNCNYNSFRNKSRMYTKIEHASNVFVIKSIANQISCIFQNYNEKSVPVISPESVKNNKIKNNRKIIFPKCILKKMVFRKLKGINNLSLEFENNLTAIMGVNGSGKSTILHALACTYSPYEKGENHQFRYFFTPNPDASWKDSSFTVVNHDVNEGKDISKDYSKTGDRWTRYSTRPMRDVFYMGITSCIPEIEVEKKTSFINYVSKSEKDKWTDKIVEDASYILNKNYEELMSHAAGKKKYIGIHTKEGIVYSALSMGAGEQRVIKMLKTVYNAHQYSLILIDEIDVLLHADAFRKLIERLSTIAYDRNLQIMFTTHSMEMHDLIKYADIRYIEQQNNKMLVYDSIKPDLLYKLSGEMNREFSIYVEDNFAAAIVREIAMTLEIQRHISIITFGSIQNAITIAAGKILGGEDLSKILIVTDGDELVTIEEKEKRLRAILTGTEDKHNEKISNALSIITQFNLPSNIKPEKYIHSMLITMSDNNEIVQCAKNIISVKDSHEWIGLIKTQMGIGEHIYDSIMSIVSEHECWGQYVSSVYEWLKKKKNEVLLISVNKE